VIGRPRVIGITGHQAIPADIADYLRDELRRRCAAAAPALIGVSCLAAGADQLFAACVLETGGTLDVIVPSRNYESAFTDPADLERFQLLLARAAHVERLDFAQPAVDAYDAAGRRVVDRADEVLAVWDGLPAKGKGGTGDIVDYARRRGKKVTNVWPAGVQRDA